MSSPFRIRSWFDHRSTTTPNRDRDHVLPPPPPLCYPSQVEISPPLPPHHGRSITSSSSPASHRDERNRESSISSTASSSSSSSLFNGALQGDVEHGRGRGETRKRETAAATPQRLKTTLSSLSLFKFGTTGPPPLGRPDREELSTTTTTLAAGKGTRVRTKTTRSDGGAAEIPTDEELESWKLSRRDDSPHGGRKRVHSATSATATATTTVGEEDDDDARAGLGYIQPSTRFRRHCRTRTTSSSLSSTTSFLPPFAATSSSGGDQRRRNRLSLIDMLDHHDKTYGGGRRVVLRHDGSQQNSSTAATGFFDGRTRRDESSCFSSNEDADDDDEDGEDVLIIDRTKSRTFSSLLGGPYDEFGISVPASSSLTSTTTTTRSSSPPNRPRRFGLESSLDAHDDDQEDDGQTPTIASFPNATTIDPSSSSSSSSSFVSRSPLDNDDDAGVEYERFDSRHFRFDRRRQGQGYYEREEAKLAASEQEEERPDELALWLDATALTSFPPCSPIPTSTSTLVTVKTSAFSTSLVHPDPSLATPPRTPTTSNNDNRRRRESLIPLSPRIAQEQQQQQEQEEQAPPAAPPPRGLLIRNLVCET